MIKHVLFIAGISIALFAVFGCDNPTTTDNNSLLVGTWDMSVQYVINPSGTIDTTEASDFYGNTYKFKTDYTVDITTTFLGTPINFSGTWSETADSVTIDFSAGAGSSTSKWAYEISENILTMTQGTDDGSGMKTTIEKYVKQ